MSSVKEAFEGQGTMQSIFFNSQQAKYQEIEPRRLLPDKIKGTLPASVVAGTQDNLSRYDPYTGKTTSRFTASALGQLLQGEAPTTEEEINCRQYQGINGLDRLIRDTSENPRAPVRCGWRYKKSPGFIPEVAQGALGTRNGPLNNNAPQDKLESGMQWIWDLQQARKIYLRDMANIAATGESLQILDSVADGQLKGRLGFCVSLNHMIPINPNETAAYPQDATLNCSADQIITDPSKLPAKSNSTNPAQILQGANLQSIRDCASGSANSLTRDCLLLAIHSNGCSSEGNLYQQIALEKSNQSRWDGSLQQQKSFQQYQSRQGNNAITASLFERNRGTWEGALSEIKRLNTAMNSSDPTVRITAQDLCKKAGTFDSYNFCDDLTDTTPVGSVDKNCLQAYWQQQNGKPAGTAYPTSRTLDSALGVLNTWGDYKKAVLELKQKTLSPNAIIQRTAMNQFYGVRVSTEVFSPKNLDGQEPNLSPPCFGLGKPSMDKQWRAFTKAECDTLKGNFYTIPSEGAGYGGCMKNTLQSLSWDCRYLNATNESSLSLWLDATDGDSLMIDGKNGVRNWNDKSGNANNILQNTISARPSYTKTGGRVGITFNGTSNFLNIPNAFTMARGEYTIFVVERRNTGNANFFIGLQESSRIRNTGLVLGYRGEDIATLAQISNDLDVKVPRYQNTLQQPVIWSFMKGSDGRSVRYNGSLVGKDSNKENLVAWNNASIGRSNTIYYNGTLYEILMYAKAIGPESRSKVEGYLAHKWGLTANLPSSHPFKNVAP